MVDWRSLRGRKGLVVEGDNDAVVIEAFLNAGQNAGRWGDWTQQIEVQFAGGINQVLSELKDSQHDIRGLIDRDNATEDDLLNRQQANPNLFVLPRWTIENYFIDFDELTRCLPPAQQMPDKLAQLKQLIEQARPAWVKHGALSQIFHRQGAHDFCRIISARAPMDDTQVEQQLVALYPQIEPALMMSQYRTHLSQFQQMPQRDFIQHIHGKNFFSQVVHRALNQVFGQQKPAAWLKKLAAGLQDCPADMVDILQNLVS